jgi:hypothetical protein
MQVKSKKGLPMLRVEDEFDLSYRPGGDFMRGEVFVEDELFPHHDENVVDTGCHNTEQSAPAAEDESIACLEETLSLASTLTSVQSLMDDTTIEGCTTAEDHQSEQDEWIDDFSLESSFSLLESPTVTEDSTAKWEMVSEDCCAVTVQKKSYCDAVKCGCSPPILPKLRHHRTDRRRSRRKTEEEDSVAFDSDFIMEGVKGSRGGKATLQFKGNQKSHPM